MPINDWRQRQGQVNVSDCARSCSLHTPRHRTPPAIPFKPPGPVKKARPEQGGEGFAQGRTRTPMPQGLGGISRDFTLLPCGQSPSKGPDPPLRLCSPRRPLGPEGRASAFQKGTKIFLRDVEGEINATASEQGAKGRERAAPSGRRRPSRPASAKHLQFN